MMSKLNIRVILSVLISLGVIFAVYTTVLGAPLSFVASQVGSHSVGGLMTNFNHDRLTVAEQDAYQFQLYHSSNSGSGHGCDSQSLSPLDD